MEEWVQASVEEGLFGCGQGIGMEEEFGKGEEGFVNGEVVGSKNPASPRNFCCAALRVSSMRCSSGSSWSMSRERRER